MATKLTVKMSLDKETKNTVRYNADDDDAAVRSVYINKPALPDQRPATITLNITA